MKSAMEFHASRIDQISISGGGAIVHFSHAYIHKSSGRPGRDPGTGWSQEMQLVFDSVTQAGVLPSLPNTITEGYLEVGGIRHDLLPIPFSRRGVATLVLLFDDGTRFEMTGARPLVELIGVARFLEDSP